MPLYLCGRWYKSNPGHVFHNLNGARATTRALLYHTPGQQQVMYFSGPLLHEHENACSITTSALSRGNKMCSVTTSTRSRGNNRCVITTSARSRGNNRRSVTTTIQQQHIGSTCVLLQHPSNNNTWQQLVFCCNICP